WSGGGHFFKSFDSGATWNGRNIPGSTLAIDPITTYEIYSPFNGLKKSTDAGVTWADVPTAPANTALAAVAFDEAVFAAGPSGIARSVDHGATWTPVLSQPLPFLNAFKSFALLQTQGDANGDGTIAVADVFYL